MSQRNAKSMRQSKTTRIAKDSGVQKASQTNAKVHFYTIHNSGEQLRRSPTVETRKKPERMEGR